jgi:hypothetical protein
MRTKLEHLIVILNAKAQKIQNGMHARCNQQYTAFQKDPNPENKGKKKSKRERERERQCAQPKIDCPPLDLAAEMVTAYKPKKWHCHWDVQINACASRYEFSYCSYVGKKI